MYKKRKLEIHEEDEENRQEPEKVCVCQAFGGENR